MHSLPLFMRLQGRRVILIGDGDAADAKRRLLDRAGAVVVGEDSDAVLAIVAVEDEIEAIAAVQRLKARGILVNAVDRVALCDFTLPAIVDRDPVLIAIGTGGASAGLAKALRQRLEALLPQSLAALATGLSAARDVLRTKFSDGITRRQALDAALGEGGALDPFTDGNDISTWLAQETEVPPDRTETLILRSTDPDDLTLRQARQLASATTIFHDVGVPASILDRARADANRIAGVEADNAGRGLTLVVKLADLGG